MDVEVRFCERNQTYYVQIITNLYERLGKMVKYRNNKWQRVSPNHPIEAQVYRDEQAVLLERRKKEKLFFRIKEDEIPPGCKIRPMPKPPAHVDRLSRRRYEKVMTMLREQGERRLKSEGREDEA